MISRPIVCAPLTAWLLGDVGAGVPVGLLYELLWLRYPPVGGYIPPDTTLASIAAAAVAAIVRSGAGVPAISLALACFLVLLPVCYVGRALDALLRAALGRFARKSERMIEQGLIRPVRRQFLAGLCLGFSIAFAALFPLVIIGTLLMSAFVPLLTPALDGALGIAFYVVPIVGMADLMVRLDDKESRALFILGFAVVLAAGLVYRRLGSLP